MYGQKFASVCVEYTETYPLGPSSKKASSLINETNIKVYHPKPSL